MTEQLFNVAGLRVSHVADAKSLALQRSVAVGEGHVMLGEMGVQSLDVDLLRIEDCGHGSRSMPFRREQLKVFIVPCLDHRRHLLMAILPGLETFC